ncbi:MAG: hypothetical protein M3450_14475 [Actinomycetota bacterium]|nr:hypothetical protein [Actinomycetota bacterium]
MADPSPIDPDRQLEELCRVLNDFGVRYVVFGSQVARLNGVPLETLDVDVVPQRDRDNLDRLAAALNSLQPRWRVDEAPGGMKIDGPLEARHLLGDSIAVGLLTAVGPVDVVLEPKGYEDGYTALAPDATFSPARRRRDPSRRPRRPRPIQGAARKREGPAAPCRSLRAATGVIAT